MPIKPRPFTFVCGECGWKKTVAPRSDVLGPGGMVHAVPEVWERSVEDASCGVG